MAALRLRIGDPTRANFSLSEVQRALNVWEQVEAFFGAATKPDVVFDSVGDETCEIRIDAFPMTDYLRAVRTNALRAATGKGDFFDSRMGRIDRSATRLPELRLSIVLTRRARLPFREIGGYLEQVFLAVNITEPGTCDFKTCAYVDVAGERTPIKLSADPLASAYLHARNTGWPKLGKVTFGETWKWLRSLHDHHTSAITPFYVSLYALYVVCIREWGHAENVSVLARSFDSLLATEKSEPLEKVVQRLELLIGTPAEGSKWFLEFHDLRSRRQRMNSDTAVQRRAIGALLAILQDVVVRGRFSLTPAWSDIPS